MWRLVAHVSGEGVLAIAHFSCVYAGRRLTALQKRSFWRDAETNTRDACATRRDAHGILSVFWAFVVAFEPVSDTDQPKGELVIQTIAMPKDTNRDGDIFGGWLIWQMNLGTAILAEKVAKARVVTV